jgi:hypothetical protein
LTESYPHIAPPPAPQLSLSELLAWVVFYGALQAAIANARPELTVYGTAGAVFCVSALPIFLQRLLRDQLKLSAMAMGGAALAYFSNTGFVLIWLFVEDDTSAGLLGIPGVLALPFAASFGFTEFISALNRGRSLLYALVAGQGALFTLLSVLSLALALKFPK